MSTEALQEDYRAMNIDLCKPGADILRDLTPAKAHLLHMASCVQGEAGELFDAMKKHIFYKQDLDMDNVVEEMGDIEFYLEGLRRVLGLSREFVLEQNMHKLRKRYGSNYSNEAAQARADKQAEPQRRFIGQPSKAPGLEDA